MWRKVSCITFFLIILLTPLSGISNGNLLQNIKVGIIDFEAPNIAYADKTFNVTVTLQNNRISPIWVSIRIELLDGLLELINKNIGNDSFLLKHGEKSKKITCKIREGDIDWYKQEYNIKAILYRDFPLFKKSFLRDSSTVRGIQVKSRLSEKDKVRIYSISVPPIIKVKDSKFDVDLKVVNEGSYNTNVRIKIFLIEKPSVIPELEDYLDLSAIATERKEIGRSSDDTIEIKSHNNKDFKIHCEIRKSESKKEKINIQAVVFVNIDGKEYQVDQSSLYGIYHNQSIIEDENIWIFIIGGIVGLIITLIFIFIIKRHYKLFRFK